MYEVSIELVIRKFEVEDGWELLFLVVVVCWVDLSVCEIEGLLFLRWIRCYMYNIVVIVILINLCVFNRIIN